MAIFLVEEDAERVEPHGAAGVASEFSQLQPARSRVAAPPTMSRIGAPDGNGYCVRLGHVVRLAEQEVENIDHAAGGRPPNVRFAVFRLALTANQR